MKIVKKFDYISPTPGEFPLITTGPNNPDTEVTEAQFRNLSVCGFNTVLFRGCHPPMTPWLGELMEKGFGYAQKYGIKIIINNDELFTGQADYGPAHETEADFIKNPYQSMFKHYRNHPSLGGWQIKDEPSLTELNNSTLRDYYLQARCYDLQATPEQYRQMGYLENEIDIENNNSSNDEFHPNPNPHLVMFNLYASDAETLAGPDKYPGYLRRISEELKPEVWSFDFYPVLQPPGRWDLAVRLGETNRYFTAVHEMSRDTGTPFWSYILTSQHINYKLAHTYGVDWQFACPTYEIMRMQAFIGLAYGAQGLVFWPFHQPKDGEMKNWGDSKFVFLAGPSCPPCFLEDDKPETIASAGNQVLRSLCRLVNELKELTPLFLESRVTDVREVAYYDRKKTDAQNGEGPGLVVLRWDGEKKEYTPRTVVETGEQTGRIDYADLSGPVGCIAGLRVFQEAGVLVSRFQKSDGGFYTMVVNQNPVGIQKVEITHNPLYGEVVKGEEPVRAVTAQEECADSAGTYTGTPWIYTIQPGDCLILKENSTTASTDVQIQ